MTALETSVASSRPIELYTFVVGSETFNYTSGQDDFIFNSTTYTAIKGMNRGAVAQGRDERNRALEIRMPGDDDLVTRWRVRPPAVQASVTVRRVQRDETPSVVTSQLVFTGFIGGIAFNGPGELAVIGALSAEASVRRQTPRFVYGGQCNWFLYEPGCGIDPNLHKFTGTVSAQDDDNSTITVPGVGAFSSKMPSGIVVPIGLTDRRSVTVQTGDVLTLNVRFSQTIVGLNIDCFKGCDRLIDGDCANEYNNVIEFGGFPFVPTKNIFGTGITS